MTILTDVDGVLLNWVDAFHAWMKEQGQEIDETAASYSMLGRYPALTSKQVDGLIEIFNSSARIGFLPPYLDSYLYARKMHEEYGVIFHCISSMGTDIYAQSLRKQNLRRFFGEAIAEVTILPLCACKREALSKYKDTGTIWLEDNIDNAIAGKQLGLKSYLFNHTYNKPAIDNRFENYFTRINTWKELYETLFCHEPNQTN